MYCLYQRIGTCTVYMRGLVHVLCTRGLVHVLCMRGLVHVLCMRGLVHVLCMRGLVHVLCMRGLVHIYIIHTYEELQRRSMTSETSVSCATSSSGVA